MFSMTDMRARLLVSWNVRTMPRRATLCGDWPARLTPSKCHTPLSGSSKPVRRLKNVVLPAPFGPMSAVISLRWTSTCSTATAVRPPKRRVTPSATRIGSDLATPAVTGGAAVCSADIEDLLPLVTEDALGPEHHEEGEHEPGHD